MCVDAGKVSSGHVLRLGNIFAPVEVFRGLHDRLILLSKLCHGVNFHVDKPRQSEVAEEWRQEIQGVIDQLQDASRRGKDPAAWMGKGLNLGLPEWAAPRRVTPPPALKAIDLRVVDEMLRNAEWVSGLFEPLYNVLMGPVTTVLLR